MTALITRLEYLPPMRVAAVLAFGATPERDALNRLLAWAGPRGYLADSDRHPVFGFNNPPPADGHPEYGYEAWIAVGPDTLPDPRVELIDYPGGLFLVTTCRLLGDPAGNVGTIWRRLWEQAHHGPHAWRPTHELERHLDPLAPPESAWLDLCLPVEPAHLPAADMVATFPHA